LAAFLAAHQPVGQAQFAAEGHRGAQRAEEAAEELVVERAEQQQGQGIGDKRPAAVEADGDGRFEGFDFDQLPSQLRRPECAQAERGEQDVAAPVEPSGQGGRRRGRRPCKN
jgi:hypothetical protein